MKKTRVLIVDDHEMVRVGLRELLSRADWLEVVGDADTVAAAKDALQRLGPDLVLLDMRLPDGSGVEVCRYAQTLPEAPKVLVLTSYADQELIISALSAGADGYLLKEINSSNLLGTIEQVLNGQSILDPGITRTVVEALRHGETEKSREKSAPLSSQEMKVLALVAEGKTNREIGEALQLSEKTVKNYFSNILAKLDLSRRSQAAAFYVKNFA